MNNNLKMLTNYYISTLLIISKKFISYFLYQIQKFKKLQVLSYLLRHRNNLAIYHKFFSHQVS